MTAKGTKWKFPVPREQDFTAKMVRYLLEKKMRQLKGERKEEGRKKG